MSNEDVPGEKRTTSPCLLCRRASITASLRVSATEQGTILDQLLKIRSAISPIKTACLTSCEQGLRVYQTQSLCPCRQPAKQRERTAIQVLWPKHPDLLPWNH